MSIKLSSCIIWSIKFVLLWAAINALVILASSFILYSTLLLAASKFDIDAKEPVVEN